MKHFIISALAFLMPLAVMADSIYNVRDFGAKGDGVNLDHVAINSAIDACTNAGGGQVLVPAGRYLCGSIRMKSNVDLHLMAGAFIWTVWSPRGRPDTGQRHIRAHVSRQEK